MNDRFGNMHRGHRIADILGSECVARGAVDTEQADDVARAGILDLFHFVRVHAHEPADSHVASRAAVDYGVPLTQSSPADANIRPLAEAALLPFECDGNQRRLE